VLPDKRGEDPTCTLRYIDRKLWNYNLSKARFTKSEASG